MKCFLCTTKNSIIADLLMVGIALVFYIYYIFNIVALIRQMLNNCYLAFL